MMQSQSQQQYEGTMLIQLIKNSERLAVIEVDVAQIKKILVLQNFAQLSQIISK